MATPTTKAEPTIATQYVCQYVITRDGGDGPLQTQDNKDDDTIEKCGEVADYVFSYCRSDSDGEKKVYKFICKKHTRSFEIYLQSSPTRVAIADIYKKTFEEFLRMLAFVQQKRTTKG